MLVFYLAYDFQKTLKHKIVGIDSIAFLYQASFRMTADPIPYNEKI